MKHTLHPALAHGAILVFGGPSEERLVSVASAQNVLAQCPVPLEAWFIDRNLNVHIVDPQAVIQHKEPFTNEFRPSNGAVFTLDQALDNIQPRRPFYICMHGTWGEDGSFQQRLEQNNIAFTASWSSACRMAFDKARAKAAMTTAGHLVPSAIELPSAGNWTDILVSIFDQQGPFVLKPDQNGSSIGLHIVRETHDLQKLLAECALPAGGIAGIPEDYIAEKLVLGREFTVGVIQTPNGLRALPVSEIRMDHHASFDYQGKYLGKNSTEITPADIDAELAAQLGSIALDAHRICGCSGYSRTDIILSENGPVFLEINTHPGLTKASFIPQQLAVAGIPFADFLETQLMLSVSTVANSNKEPSTV